MVAGGKLDAAVLHRDETLALLRAIDSAILEIADNTPVQNVEDLFLASLAEFSRLHGLGKTPTIVVYMGHEFQPLRRTRRKGGARPLPITASLRRFVDGDQAGQFISDQDDPALFEGLGVAQACLIAPVFTPERHLLCLLITTGAVDDEISRLRNSDVSRALKDLSAQLTIAYSKYEQARFHSELRDLWAAFLDHNLAPTICFRALAQRIPRFLPKFGPLGVGGPLPQVQILMLPKVPAGAPQPKHLVIRGTTVGEHSGTRVAVRRSISGILLTQPKLDLFCGDPTAEDYRGLYKNYFDDSKHRARTELAVRMTAGGDVVGIINIESRVPDAFAYLHQQTLLGLAGNFGRLAAVLEERLTMNTRMQNSVATSTRNYLDALASTFRHGIATPLAAQELDADTLGVLIAQAEARVTELGAQRTRGAELEGSLDDLKDLLKEMRETQRDLAESRDETDRYSADFINDISGYADEGQIVLREIVDSAIQLAINSLLARKARHTTIRVTHDASLPTTHIYCSTLIKQHFYSIFHNAVDAIKKRLETDGRPGRINVSIEEEEIPQGQEQQLNKAWIVRIRDNGQGVSAAQLRDLRKFEPGVTFKGSGHGYGLTAAQRYVASIGGRMKLTAVRGRFFEVALYLDEYNAAVHGNLLRLSSKGGLYGQAAEGTYRRG